MHDSVSLQKILRLKLAKYAYAPFTLTSDKPITPAGWIGQVFIIFVQYYIKFNTKPDLSVED